MEKLGKIFGILVLVLALAVAALSYFLFAQRQAFRAHSEDLAEGLMQIKAKLDAADGCDVSSQLSKVSYAKGANGGKETGSLGFEEYKKDSASAKNAIQALNDALDKRLEQSNKFGLALAEISKALREPSKDGVTEKTVFTTAADESAEESAPAAEGAEGTEAAAEESSSSDGYAKKVDAIVAHAKNVGTRDEIIRSNLEKLAKTVGVSPADLSAGKFNSASNGITAVMTEFANAAQLMLKRNQAYVAVFGEARKAIPEYKAWKFNPNELVAANGKFNATSKAAGKDADRNAYLKQLADKLAVFGVDAKGINAFIAKLNTDINKLKGEVSNWQGKARAAQQANEKLTAENNQLKAEYKELSEHYEFAKKTLEERQAGNTILAELPEPQKTEVAEVSAIPNTFRCSVLRVDSAENVVILSATKFDVCVGAKLLIKSSIAPNDVICVEVKEVANKVSKAYVTRGDARKISIGDEVYLSVDNGR